MRRLRFTALRRHGFRVLRSGGLLRGLAWGVLLAFVLGACTESSDTDLIEDCRKLMDEAAWDDAIASCPDDGSRGTSLLAQAYMGRAGVSVLDLLDALENSPDLQGEALILELFALKVNSAEFDDAVEAVNLMLTIAEPSNTASLNLTIVSDVLLMSLLKARLSVSVDPDTQELIVPGVTDTGIENLSSASSVTKIQTVFDNIYTNNGKGSGSYYTVMPRDWDDPSATTDLSRITDYVKANQQGADALELTTDPDLADLEMLAFYPRIDNGTCGYSSGTTIDPDVVARDFPRRHNTSDPNGDYLSDELQFTIFDATGSTDTTKEWEGEFRLPTALLNPDYFKVDCDNGTAALGEFSTCMETATTLISPNTPGATQTLDASLTTTADDTGTICDGADCTSWPLLLIDADPTTDESGTNGDTAKTELSQVLDTVAPIDNTEKSPSGTRPAYACKANDGLVHYREYDSYLRNFKTQ